MKRTLIAASLATVALAGAACGSPDGEGTHTATQSPSAATAEAEHVPQTPSSRFLDAIHNAGVPQSLKVDTSAVNSAKANCRLLGAGGTVTNVIDVMLESTPMTGEQTAVFVYEGIKQFCPVQLATIQEAGA